MLMVYAKNYIKNSVEFWLKEDCVIDDIKYIFTGDLKKIKSFVPFQGKEMHLLKC